MSRPKKRTVTVRLTPRVKNDPEAILEAVREACRRVHVEIRVVTKPDTPEDCGPEEKRIALEHLEAAALHHAATTLNEKANAIAKKSERTNPVASPSRIVAVAQRVGEFLRAIGPSGWKVIVEVAKGLFTSTT